MNVTHVVIDRDHLATACDLAHHLGIIGVTEKVIAQQKIRLNILDTAWQYRHDPFRKTLHQVGYRVACTFQPVHDIRIQGASEHKVYAALTVIPEGHVEFKEDQRDLIEIDLYRRPEQP